MTLQPEHFELLVVSRTAPVEVFDAQPALVEVYDWWDPNLKQLTFHAGEAWGREQRKDLQFLALDPRAEPPDEAVAVLDWWDPQAWLGLGLGFGLGLGLASPNPSPFPDPEPNPNPDLGPAGAKAGLPPGRPTRGRGAQGGAVLRAGRAARGHVRRARVLERAAAPADRARRRAVAGRAARPEALPRLPELVRARVSVRLGLGLAEPYP